MKLYAFLYSSADTVLLGCQQSFCVFFTNHYDYKFSAAHVLCRYLEAKPNFSFDTGDSVPFIGKDFMIE